MKMNIDDQNMTSYDDQNEENKNIDIHILVAKMSARDEKQSLSMKNSR